MRSIQSRVGVTVGGEWYCSADCFVAAVRKRYSSLSATKVVETRHVPRRPIGLLLLSKGFLTEQQLRAAVRDSLRLGEDLEQTLKRTGVINDQQIAIARAAQWGYPVIGQDQPILEVEADIPAILLRACSAVPVHYSAAAKRLVIGFVERIDHSFLSSLEEITGILPEPCFITPTQFAEQLRCLTPPPRWEEIVSDVDCTPAQMANTTGRFAIEIGARDARFQRCKDRLWTRLIGKRRVLDLLYKTRSARSETFTSAVNVVEGDLRLKS
jgi:hypothetical protein